VLLVNGGDNMYDTLLPRLMNMGAKLHDFTIVSAITTYDPAEMRAGKADTDRRLCLPADLGHIEYQLRQRPDTRLVIVDSLSDFCQTDKQEWPQRAEQVAALGRSQVGRRALRSERAGRSARQITAVPGAGADELLP
jgi:hypothetical protein